MTNQELIDTLKTASQSMSSTNIAISMLLLMAAERLEAFIRE